MSTDQANAENYRVPDELLPEPPDDLDYDDYDDYWANPPETPDELNSMVANYNAPPDTGETDSKGSIADKVVTLAEERYTFGISEDGATFGRRAGSPVARMLRGGNTSLRSELANAYRKAHRKTPSSQALSDAMSVIEGVAQDAEPTPVALRVAATGGQRVWLDVGDKAEHVICLAPQGWHVCAPNSGDRVPVLFRRTKLTGPLPLPASAASEETAQSLSDIDELWDVLNVAAPDRPLVLGWLVAALCQPDVPRPILALFGEQGTGKSTAAKTLVALTDPSAAPLRKPPRDPDAWVNTAQGSWVLAIDNLSEIRDWLSDSLCRAVTGDADVRRTLYSDLDLTVVQFRRSIILNGIDVGALRGDLADRSLVVNLDTIAENRRRSEHDLNQSREAAYPRVFAALLDICCRVLAELPNVKLDSSPRMADFARVLAALDRLGATTGGLDRYNEQARTLAADTLSAEPLILAMQEHLPDTFTGTSAELLDQLEAAAYPADHRKPPGWPKNARAVTSVLKRTAPALRKQDWDVGKGAKDNRARSTTWHLTRPEIDRIPHSQRSTLAPEPENLRVASVASNKNATSHVEPLDEAPTCASEPAQPAQPAQPALLLTQKKACKQCDQVPTDSGGLGDTGYCLKCETSTS